MNDNKKANTAKDDNDNNNIKIMTKVEIITRI